MLRPLIFFAIIVVVLIYYRDSSTTPPARTPPPALRPTPAVPVSESLRTSHRRTVAVGDLHSDLAQALAVLRMAGIVDNDSNWSGGSATLVQTGDIVDRGPDTIALYNLFDKLRTQAKEAGGEVVNVFGNHEVMNLGGDLRYVTEEDYASFGGRQKRREAWDVRSGWLGKQIFGQFNITYVHHGHTVFSHGDMEAEWAQLGVEEMNDLAHEAIWNSNYRAPIFQGTGPIWSRSHALLEGGEAETCQKVEAVKKALGVNRLVSGHTPQYQSGRIMTICNGGYMVIDVGISKYYGGHLAALEIIEKQDGSSQDVYALYPGGKVLL